MTRFERNGPVLTRQDIENKLLLLKDIVIFCQNNAGKKICCKEYISTGKAVGTILTGQADDNRHFTSRSVFYLTLKWAGIRISGAVLMIYNGHESLEINTGDIFYGECTGSSFRTIEQFTGECSRTIEVELKMEPH